MPTSSGGTAYSDQQVYALLLGSATESFTFDWLDQEGWYRGDLTRYVVQDSVPQLSYDATAAVKRSLRFQTLGMPSGLNPLADMVRPHYRLLAPDGGWLDWPLGTLLLNPPQKNVSEGYSLYNWTASDLSDLLVQDQFLESYSVGGGNDVVASIRDIIAGLQGPQLSTLITGAPRRPLILHDSLSWDAGKSRLEAINDLLAAVGFRPLWCDEQGQLRAQEIPDYNQEVAIWTWDASAGRSVILSGSISEEADMSNVVNVCKVIGQDPRAHTPIAVTYTNNRPDSPVSVAKLRRRRVKVVQDSSVADEASAQVRAMAEVQAGARIYAKFTVETLHWPVWASGDYDLIHLVYSSAAEGLQDWNYLVLGWTMQMLPGGTTSHTLQRIIPA